MAFREGTRKTRALPARRYPFAATATIPIIEFLGLVGEDVAVPDPDRITPRAPLRVGAVSYLNSKPLIHALDRNAADLEVIDDLPSRLADRLAAGELDVALVPSIEYFRHGGYTIVSDACIASDGPVRSVKLYGRVPPPRIRSLALDEGSRTSAALARILLRERFGLTPEIVRLPIGTPVEETRADAAMLIGDRGMHPPQGQFEFIWDLGQEWRTWTDLPFVFAMWIARPGADLPRLDEVLRTARDQGLTQLDEIARQHALAVRLPECECLAYLRDHLRFHLGERQRRGLQRFYELAAQHGLAPAGVRLDFFNPAIAR
jgi:chorismate dehydratase